MMRNVLCLGILLSISSAGVLGACAKNLKYITQRGNFKIVNNQIQQDTGYEYDWSTCKEINSQPDYATGVQECYGGLHDLPYWKIVSFSQTCSVITVQEVTGGMRFGEPIDVVNFCDCLEPEDPPGGGQGG